MAEKDWRYWNDRIDAIRNATVQTNRSDVAYMLYGEFEADGLSWAAPEGLPSPVRMTSELATEIMLAIEQETVSQQPKTGKTGSKVHALIDELVSAAWCHDRGAVITATEHMVDSFTIDIDSEQPITDVVPDTDPAQGQPALFDEVQPGDRVILGVRPGMARRLIEITFEERSHGERINWQFREMDEASALTSVNREEWERWGAVYAKCRGFRP